MIRGLFFVVGLFALLQGVLCLCVESMTITELAAARLEAWTAEDRLLVVPAWFGPTLVFTGGVTLLYAVALPARRPKHKQPRY